MICMIHYDVTKWRHFLHYRPFCEGNPSVTSEFLSQRPVAQSFEVLAEQKVEQTIETPVGNYRAHDDVTVMQ